MKTIPTGRQTVALGICRSKSGYNPLSQMIVKATPTFEEIETMHTHQSAKAKRDALAWLVGFLTIQGGEIKVSV